jgi:hypothetical protein
MAGIKSLKIGDTGEPLEFIDQVSRTQIEETREQVENIDASLDNQLTIPDYTAPITVGASPFTAPCNGVFTYSGTVSTGSNTKSITVNGSGELDGAHNTAGYMGGNQPGKMIPLKKGDKLTYNGYVVSPRFFPYAF